MRLHIVSAFAVSILLVEPAVATLLEPGRDVIFRFDISKYEDSDFQTNWLLDTPLRAGAKSVRIDFGTSRGSSRLGSNVYDISFLGTASNPGWSSSLFPKIPDRRNLYITYGYTGTEIDFDTVDLGVLAPSGFEIVSSREVAPPKARVVPSPTPESQGASVISAFRKYIEGAENTEKTYAEKLNDCAILGAECDFDAVRNDQEFRENLQNAADATYASKDLVTRTSILPQNELELIADAPFLVNEIKAFLQWVGLAPEDVENSEISSINVEGEAGQFTVNPTFQSISLTYTLDFLESSVFSGLEGESFLFNRSFLGADYAGYGIIESVDRLDSGGERLIFSISQLESNNALSDATVPLPGTLVLFGLGLAGLGWSRRKKV